MRVNGSTTRRACALAVTMTLGCAATLTPRSGPRPADAHAVGGSPTTKEGTVASVAPVAPARASASSAPSVPSDGALVIEAPGIMTKWKDRGSRLGLADLPGRTFVVGLDRVAWLVDGKVVSDPALEAGLSRDDKGRLVGWIEGMYGEWPSAAWLQLGAKFYRWSGDTWSEVGSTPWLSGGAIGWNGGLLVIAEAQPLDQRLMLLGASPLPPPMPLLGPMIGGCKPTSPLNFTTIGANAADEPIVAGNLCSSFDRHAVLRWPAGKKTWVPIGPKNFRADTIRPVPGTADGVLLVGELGYQPRALRIVGGQTTELEVPPHTEGERLDAYVETKDGAVAVLGDYPKGRLVGRSGGGAWHNLTLAHPKWVPQPYDAWRIGDEVFVAANLHDGSEAGAAAIYRLVAGY